MEQQPSKAPSILGCLMVPAGFGGLLLALGIWLISGWSGHLPVVKVLAVILVVFGSLIVLAIGALVLLATLMARMARDAVRDARSLSYSLRYMMNMGRMGNSRQDEVEVQAEEVTPPQEPDSNQNPPPRLPGDER